ncbi:MAG: hypothetical protein JRI56_11470 [Deltaproteobacteria bacterium]|nr:hypothetical protein [Deltaproteobacteria bacterium]
MNCYIDEKREESEYWGVVGIIHLYWEATTDLVSVDHAFDFNGTDWPVGNNILR